MDRGVLGLWFVYQEFRWNEEARAGHYHPAGFGRVWQNLAVPDRPLVICEVERGGDEFVVVLRVEEFDESRPLFYSREAAERFSNQLSKKLKEHIAGAIADRKRRCEE